MKLHILSDLHIEFTGHRYKPVGRKWPDSDILILAGDIGVGRSARSFIEKRVEESIVIYVLGNHEFYNNDMNKIREYWQNLSNEIENLYVLDNTTLDIGEYRFIGTTLWSDTSGDKISMNDYNMIENFSQYDCRNFYLYNKEWLEEEVEKCEKKIIIVTHHLPSFQCIEKKYYDPLYNKAYASNLEHILGKDNVKMWIHGHTHCSIDKDINGTRVICNPRGYTVGGGFQNEDFNENLVVEVENKIELN